MINMYASDQRIILTLDAGGTNFVYSAIQGYKSIVEPICYPSEGHNIDRCLKTLEQGFRTIISKLNTPPSAISFAFPGPADYEHGIIGDLCNLPAFRGGIALGPYLNEIFGIPVFIQNDGNLFAYGEALAGFLPEVNNTLKENGNNRRYHNLLGITLGTGFGAGVVINGQLLSGDNGCGGDVWCMRNHKYPHLLAEESVSIRAVLRVYSNCSGESVKDLTPFDIFQIAEGLKMGHIVAAQQSFYELGQMAGEAIADALDIVDGLVVLGGGLCGARKYIIPGLMESLKSRVNTNSGESFPRLQVETFFWNDEEEQRQFISTGMDSIEVPHFKIHVPYLRRRSICIGFSRFGATTSIMNGAYAYALQQLDRL